MPSAATWYLQTCRCPDSATEGRQMHRNFGRSPCRISSVGIAMNEIRCPSCEANISVALNVCPNCGAPSLWRSPINEAAYVPGNAEKTKARGSIVTPTSLPEFHPTIISPPSNQSSTGERVGTILGGIALLAAVIAWGAALVGNTSVLQATVGFVFFPAAVLAKYRRRFGFTGFAMFLSSMAVILWCLLMLAGPKVVGERNAKQDNPNDKPILVEDRPI
jgi:hypothetical protein